MLNRQQLRAIAKRLGVYLQAKLNYPRPAKTRTLPQTLTYTMLTAACIRKVQLLGANTVDDATRLSSMSRTPQTLPELASMLRDTEDRLRCPFGIDWEDKSGGCLRLDRLHRIPFWLVLIEMHGDGYRYGMRGDRDLPFVFDRLIKCLRQRRIARQQASQGASEHLIGVPDDLGKALLANPVFRDKIATHDLLTYTLKESRKYIAM